MSETSREAGLRMGYVEWRERMLAVMSDLTPQPALLYE